MSPELLEINPRELKFTFELKKQSSCSVQLVNNSNHYVAFKVKTTSPKKYCVRPNTGIVLPKSTCDFTVTMQAQRIASSDMQCKDKFLIQSTIVPSGTTEAEIQSSFFSKESNRVIEESKLRVVLVSPPHSPVLQPIIGGLKNDSAMEVSSKEIPHSNDALVLKDQVLSGFENVHPSHLKDVEDLKSLLNDLESKLLEAEKANARLREENKVIVQDRDKLQQELANITNTKLNGGDSLVIQERDKLQQELVLLRRKCAAKVQVGFPFLFVCFVVVVGVALGHLMHP